MKYLLLQNKKLMGEQEEKVKILVAICASLPVIAEEAALLWAAGVPDPDATIITGATTSSSVKPGTSTGEITPQSIRFIGLWPHHLARLLPSSCTPWLFQLPVFQTVTGTQHLIMKWRAALPIASVGSLVMSVPHPQISRMQVRTPH